MSIYGRGNNVTACLKAETDQIRRGKLSVCVLARRADASTLAFADLWLLTSVYFFPFLSLYSLMYFSGLSLKASRQPPQQT